MNVFVNDYNDLCHKEVLDTLINLNKKGNGSYGRDIYSDKAKEYIKRDLENEDVHIEFLAGGTIANIVAISANLLPYESVIAASSGHISCHETASIEATGHKVEIIDTEDGKLTPELIYKKVTELCEEFHTSPKMVYISQTTETGSVYSYDEINKIYRMCLELGLYLYIDGARMAVGLAASDIEIFDLPELCDIFTLGGTKNGATCGEALVIVADELKENIRRYMKQRGAIMAKGFFIGAQFMTLFKDGLYYELGKTSYDLSMYLSKGLKNIGVEFSEEPLSNQIFINFKTSLVDKLRENNSFEIINTNKDTSTIRLVTNYQTTKDEIDNLILDIKNLTLTQS